MNKVEFTYYNEEERKFMEDIMILRVINSYLDEIKEIDKISKYKKDGDIFNKKIAFIITKEIIPPMQDEYTTLLKSWSERINLEPMQIQEIKYEPPIAYKPKKYSFKERLKVLFKGKL